MAFNFKSLGDIANAVSSAKELASTAADIFQTVKEKSAEPDKKNGNSRIQQTTQPSVQEEQGGIKFSDALEGLINMALQDGEISDEEMRMLNKRAEKEGIDLDEFQFILKKRIKRRVAELERSKNPVTQIADAFKMAESYAENGSSIDSGALSAALSLIPGVGAVAAVGGLASSLIKTPSNLNRLKAEIINNAKIPENEKDMSDFMLFCHSQLEAETAGKNAKKNSLSNMLSGVTMGDALDLVPIWKTKINHLVSRSKVLFPDSPLIQSTIKQVYVSPAGELKILLKKSRSSFCKELKGLTAPEDDGELLEVIELLYGLKDETDLMLDVTEAHKRLFGVAEQRFSNDFQKTEALNKYRIKKKKFGFF